MRELRSVLQNEKELRWQLLTTVSALALLAAICNVGEAEAADEVSHPPLWIELGGQLERVDGGQQPFSAPFLTPLPSFITSTPATAQRSPRYSIGGEAKISFTPEGTDWAVSASVRYGRSNGIKHAHQSEYVTKPPKYIPGVPSRSEGLPSRDNFDDITNKSSETHAIIDFQAGKDVGLGTFGRKGSSTINVGVRIAQFTSKSDVEVKARPDLHYYNYKNPPTRKYAAAFHNYALTGSADRGTHLVGPSISWDATATITGSSDATQVMFDWGVNAAALFGRQKAKIHRETHGSYIRPHRTQPPIYGQPTVTQYQHASDHNRSRSVVVPNIGGFAGLSLKFPNAKISLGYRGDFFFGAMDGGIDTRKTYNRNFYGPFAAISVGLGG